MLFLNSIRNQAPRPQLHFGRTLSISDMNGTIDPKNKDGTHQSISGHATRVKDQKDMFILTGKIFKLAKEQMLEDFPELPLEFVGTGNGIDLFERPHDKSVKQWLNNLTSQDIIPEWADYRTRKLGWNPVSLMQNMDSARTELKKDHSTDKKLEIERKSKKGVTDPFKFYMKAPLHNIETYATSVKKMIEATAQAENMHIEVLVEGPTKTNKPNIGEVKLTCGINKLVAANWIASHYQQSRGYDRVEVSGNNFNDLYMLRQLYIGGLPAKSYVVGKNLHPSDFADVVKQGKEVIFVDQLQRSLSDVLEEDFQKLNIKPDDATKQPRRKSSSDKLRQPSPRRPSPPRRRRSSSPSSSVTDQGSIFSLDRSVSSISTAPNYPNSIRSNKSRGSLHHRHP